MINTLLFVLPAAETLELLLLQVHLFTFSEEINDSSSTTRQTLNQSYKCFCWRNCTNSPVREQTSAAAHQVYIILYNKSNWMRTSSTSTCYTKISFLSSSLPRHQFASPVWTLDDREQQTAAWRPLSMSPPLLFIICFTSVSFKLNVYSSVFECCLNRDRWNYFHTNIQDSHRSGKRGEISASTGDNVSKTEARC